MSEKKLGIHFDFQCYFSLRIEYPNNIIPTVMALSAMLKTGQIRKSKKSTIYPNRIRSDRFPAAPPKIKPKEMCLIKGFCFLFSIRYPRI